MTCPVADCKVAYWRRIVEGRDWRRVAISAKDARQALGSAELSCKTLHGTCTVLVADPPWRFDLGTSTNPRRFRGTVDQHYPSLSVGEIMRFPLPNLAGAAHLFLWRVASMQQEAFDVANAWGFTIKSELVWKKLTVKGKRWFGMGRRVRMEHEVCLIGVRGPAQVLDRSVRSIFEAVVPEGKHSAKPDEFFEIVHRLCGPPTPATHVELFARNTRPGWATYGNELELASPVLVAG